MLNNESLTIQLRHKLPSAKVAELMGHHATREHFDALICGNATIFKPNGQPLAIVFREAFSQEITDAAYPYLHWLGKYVTHNRTLYSGGEKIRRVKRDGTLAPSSEAPVTNSVVTGYLDDFSARFLACRATNYVTDNIEGWGAALPFIQRAAEVFKKRLPDRYAAQQAIASRTHPTYVIPKTCFTSVTVNNCEAAGYHIDAGDYKPGFGAMSVLRRGQYEGAELCFPAYGVAIDLQDRDLVLFDVHEVHGNTLFKNTVGERYKDWERVSMVYYFREAMEKCLSPEAEVEKAKKRADTYARRQK